MGHTLCSRDLHARPTCPTLLVPLQRQAMKPRLLAGLFLVRRSLSSTASSVVGWHGNTYRSRSSVWRWYSTPALSRPEKPYYITTPIFYVNAGEEVEDVFLLTRLIRFQLHMSDIYTRWF